MALSKPDALIAHKSLNDPKPTEVTYVDDERRDPSMSAPGIDLEDD